MIEKEWSARHITDSTQRILKQIPSRASPTNILPPAARPDEPQMPDIGCKQPGNRTARRNTK